MKLSTWFAVITLAVTGTALFASCANNNNNPTNPAATATPVPPTATNTFTPTPTATVTFNWVNAYWYDFPLIGSQNYIDFDFQVNGAPSTTAGVTVTGGGVTLTIPLNASPVSVGGYACANYRLSPVTFTAGVSYVFSTTANGQTAAATVVAPGVFTPVTDPTTPYNGAVTLLTWGAVTQGYIETTETGPAAGSTNAFSITPADTSLTLATVGAGPASVGYAASAPSTYTLQLELRNSVAAPAGSYGDCEIQNYSSQPLTLQ